MTSIVKPTTSPDVSLLTEGQSAEAADVKTPINDLAGAIDVAQTRLSVSSNDTHVKNLADALAPDSGGFITAWQQVNDGADETIRPTFGTLPHEQGGLEANVSAYSGLLKISGGSTSQAVAGTDYLSPTGSETVTNKTIGSTNDVDPAAIGQGGASPGDALLWSGTAWAPGAAGGGGAEPVDLTVTAGETLAERDVVFIDMAAGTAKKIDIDAATPLVGFLRGVVNEAGGIASAASGSVRILGEVSGFTGLTAWATVYASTTAGGYTQAKPGVTDGGNQVAVVPIGVAVATTKVMVMNGLNVKYLKRETLANNGTLTITHQSDLQGRERQVSAYVAGTTTATATSYAETNQDSNVNLRRNGAGSATSVTASGNFYYIGAVTSTNYWSAQSFQMTNAGILNQITFLLQANEGTPTGTITWEIRTDNAGAPSATILQSNTHSPTASATNTVTVTGGITLETSTTYWLLLRPTSAQTGSNNWRWQRTNGTSTYADGFASSTANSGSSYTSLPNDDFQFSVTTGAETAKDKLAQSFQVTGATDVTSVRLWLKKTGSPTGNLTVKIQTDTAGAPSGTTVTNGTSATVAASTLATSYGMIEFDFSTNPALSGSTTYWLVLETTDSDSTSNYVVWGADGSTPGYADGSMSSEASAVWGAESKDACFEVLETATSFDEPAVVGRWSGGTRDIAARFDDGARSDGNTKTTFKNVSGSSLDVTCVVELN